MKILRIMLLWMAGLLLAVPPARAADPYPSHPIRLIVPFPPGGTAGSVARLIGKALNDRLGQPIVIENKGGAATIIGTMDMVRAPADGYTLLLSGPSTFTANPATNPDLPYDPLKDMELLGLVASVPVVMVANVQAPFDNIVQLLETARTDPAAFNYGALGPGSLTNLAGEAFFSAAGLRVQSIPYKGSSQALNDVMGGQIPMSVDTMLPVAPLVRQGRLKAIALLSGKRSDALPDVPTAAESGFDVDISSWLGIAAPRGLPAETKAVLVEALAGVLGQEDLRHRLNEQGVSPELPDPQAFRKRVAREIGEFRAIVRRQAGQP